MVEPTQLKPCCFKSYAQHIGLMDGDRIIFQTSKLISNRPAFDKAPDVRVETSVFLLVLQNLAPVP